MSNVISLDLDLRHLERNLSIQGDMTDEIENTSNALDDLSAAFQKVEATLNTLVTFSDVKETFKGFKIIIGAIFSPIALLVIFSGLMDSVEEIEGAQA